MTPPAENVGMESSTRLVLTILLTPTTVLVVATLGQRAEVSLPRPGFRDQGDPPAGSSFQVGVGAYCALSASEEVSSVCVTSGTQLASRPKTEVGGAGSGLPRAVVLPTRARS